MRKFGLLAVLMLGLTWSQSRAQNFSTGNFGIKPVQPIFVKVDTTKTVAPVPMPNRKTGFSFRDFIPGFIMPFIRPLIGESGAAPGPLNQAEYLSQFPIVTGPVVTGPVVSGPIIGGSGQ